MHRNEKVLKDIRNTPVKWTRKNNIHGYLHTNQKKSALWIHVKLKKLSLNPSIYGIFSFLHIQLLEAFQPWICVCSNSSQIMKLNTLSLASYVMNLFYDSLYHGLFCSCQCLLTKEQKENDESGKDVLIWKAPMPLLYGRTEKT